MVPHSFILHLLLSAYTSLLFDFIFSDGLSYHCCTHLYHPIRPFFFFEIHTKLCTSQLSFDAQRHVRFTVQNSTHHIPSQICVFLIKSMSLLSINDQAKNLRVFWIPFSVTCHQNLLTVPYITDLFLVLIITITLS